MAQWLCWIFLLRIKTNSGPKNCFGSAKVIVLQHGGIVESRTDISDDKGLRGFPGLWRFYGASD